MSLWELDQSNQLTDFHIAINPYSSIAIPSARKCFISKLATSNYSIQQNFFTPPTLELNHEYLV